ncbi:MAG: CapA family protein, partial [Lachnospiraceae bacterium]|nr:CapA family protein [Lachnospiraceae bacterium]
MDKRELNQNGLADENGRDESPVTLPDETPKIQKKRRSKKRPPQSADSSAPKSDAVDKSEPVISDTGNSESTPKKKKRPVSAEGTPQKKAGPVSTEGTPKKKKRPVSAEGAPQKKAGQVSTERAPKKKKRPVSAEDAPQKRRRPEGTEGVPHKRRRPEGTSKTRRTVTERAGSARTRQKKKRTYADVLKDLVLDTSLMAILIKAVFCLILFLIVLFVARGIRNKGKAPKPEVTESSIADESSLSAVQTELQQKTETFLDGGAQAVDDNSITILGVGDNLAHEQVFLTASTGSGYDFRPFYKNIKPFITSADLATVNQETPLATALGSASGYPHFNT